MKSIALCATFVACFLAACGGDDGNAPHPGAVDTTIDDGPAALTNLGAAMFVFHATPVGDAGAFQCAVDGADPAGCSSPFAVTVGAGDHTFSVAALDAAGNPDATPATRTWKVDTTPPETTLTAQPAAIDNTPTPTFAFTGTDDSGSTLTFACALDGADFAACTSPQQLAALADGSHTFAVRAIDGAGNPDPSPASATWVIDTTSPDTTITGGPDEAGVSNATPAFAFTSSLATATFECALDPPTGAFAACTSPFTPPAALASGAHTFAVRAKDANGVVDPTPAMRGWTVDADPPDVAIDSSPASPSNLRMPVFAFSSTDATATFECAIGAAGTFAACASPYTVPGVGDGANLFKVRAVDPVGNRTASPATFSWQVDTIAPTLTLTSQPPAASNDATATVTFTFLGGPVTISCVVDTDAAIPCDSPFTTAALAEGSHTIAVTVTDTAGNAATKTTTAFAIDLTPPSVMIMTAPPNPTKVKTPQFVFAAPGAAKLECSLDGAAFATCVSPLTTGALVDGSHTFTVRGTDAVGNAATASSTFVVDTAPPTLTINTSPANPTNITTAVVAFTVGAGPATTTCQVDAVPAAACTSPFTSGALLEGSHTITVVATDTAGNTTTAAKTFAIDLTAPVVMITSSPPSPTNTKVGTIAFTVTGGAVSTQCSLDGAAFTPCSSSVTTPALTDGSHTFVVKSTDAAGNAGTATAMWTVQTGAPVVTIMSAPTGTIGVKTASVAFTVTGTNVQTIQCQLDTGAFATCTSPYMVAGLGDGSHTITIKATDAASNAGTAFATFTVDTTPPTVVFNAQPAAHTNVVPPQVTFTISGGAVSTKCAVDGGAFADCISPFSAAGLSDGDHTISVRATDFVGNAATTVATFNLDTVTPTATITSGPGALTNQTKPVIMFSTTDAPTTIQCQVDTLGFATCSSPFTSSTLVDGPHTIAIKVADLAGNTSTTSTTFTVDATPPGIVINTKPPASWNSTTATITFTATGAASTDCSLDGAAFGACTSGSSYTVMGLSEMSHTMTVRATDTAGNTATASATFTVDVTPPTVHITTTFTTPVANTKPAIAFTSGGQIKTECQVDTGAFADCTTGFASATDLSQSDHTYTVRVTDAAGNQATDSVTFTVDTIAPVVTIDPTQPTLTNNALQSVAFTVTGSPTKIECQLETTGTFAACTSPFIPGAALGEGSHTVTVKGTDAAGNHAQAAITFTVDTLPPPLGFTQQPAAQTATAATTFKWTVSGQQSVACTLDGVTVTCTSTTSYATGTLLDGMHTFVVKATDAATNAATITAMWTIDTTGPAFSLLTQPATPTNDTMPVVTYDVAGDAATVECRLDTAAFAACPLPLGTYTTAVGAGTHTLSVRESDALGNQTVHATGSFVVDLTAPTVTIGGPANGAPTTAPSFALSANEAGSTFQCKVDTGAYAACTTPVSPAFTGSGTHTLAVQATDPAGNVSTAATVTVTVDPIVECLAGIDAGTGSLAATSTATLAQATIELWYRAGAATTQDLLTFDVPLDPTGPAVDLSIVAGKLVVTVNGAGGTLADQVRYTPAGSLAAWHHYAVELTGTATRVFVDGTELTGTLLGGAATATFASAFTGETNPISIHPGGNAFGGEANADGGMLGLRVSSSTLYTAAFTPPAFPFGAPVASTVLLFGLDDGVGLTSDDEHTVPAATITWPAANWTASCF